MSAPRRSPARTDSEGSVADDPEYLVVGHCALDIQPDGSVLPGGTVLYSALTAARLGMRVAVLTAGEPAALGAALVPYRDLFALHVIPTDDTTRFENVATPTGRVQTLHGWGGLIPPESVPAAWRRPRILHLGPIADELPPDDWARAIGTVITAPLTMATPQGWLRRWGSLPARVRHVPLSLPDALLDRVQTMVISVEERDVAETAVRRVARRGYGVITDGPRGVEILRGNAVEQVPAFPVAVRDETGAGDVFAAAWAVGLARGQQPTESARAANAAAALSITAAGPQGIPTTAEIAALFAGGPCSAPL